MKVSIAPFFLILLPWLNPFSLGPSPATVPLLFSWVSSGVLVWVFIGMTGRVAAERLVSTIAAAWLAAALLSSIMALLQYFGATAVFGPWVNSTGLGEAYANLRQRNQFATLTNIGLAALLWWVAHRPSMTELLNPKSPSPHWLSWHTALAVLAAVLLAAGNAASSSRTGLVQLVLLLAMTLLWGGRRKPALLSVLLAALLAYGVANGVLPLLAGLDPHATGILSRLHDGGPACTSRLTLWGNVLHLISLRPWLGWGWGELDYAHFITLYPGPRFCEILDNAHNLPLHLAVELGVPVALLACGGGLWLTWRAKPWREKDATRQMAWAVMAVILLHSLLEYPLWYGPFQMAFGLSLWLLCCTPDSQAQVKDRSMHLAPVLYALAATFLIVFSGYAAWDYHRISQIYTAPKLRDEAYRDNTLEKIGDSWLFQGQVRFAKLTTTEVTRTNAAQLNEMAKELLDFSPEPRVIEKVIESAVQLGHDDEARFYMQRYRAAFPEQQALWVKANKRLLRASVLVQHGQEHQGTQ